MIAPARPKTVKCQLTKTCYYGILEGHEKLINWSKQLVKYMPASTCDKFHQRQIYFFLSIERRDPRDCWVNIELAMNFESLIL